MPSALATERERWAVADVSLPKRVGKRGLPSQSGLWSLAVAEGDAIEAMLAKELSHCAREDLAFLDSTIGLESPQDERHGGVWVLAPYVAQERTKLWAKVPPAAAIGATIWAEAVHSDRAKSVVPTLEGGDRVRARGVGIRGPVALPRQAAKGRGELAASQVARGEGRDDGMSKMSHGLPVVARDETCHVQDASFRVDE